MNKNKKEKFRTRYNPIPKGSRVCLKLFPECEGTVEKSSGAYKFIRWDKYPDEIHIHHIQSLKRIYLRKSKKRSRHSV